MRWIWASVLWLLLLVPILTRHHGGSRSDARADRGEVPAASSNLARRASAPFRRSSLQLRSIRSGPGAGEYQKPPAGTEIRSVDAPDTVETRAQAISDDVLEATLDSLPPDLEADVISLRQLLVRRWTTFDLQAAATWASGLWEGVARDGAIGQIAFAWAEADLPGSMVWVQGLPEGGSKDSATLGIAYEAARTDPVAALRLAATLDATTERDALLSHAVSQWAEGDPESAAKWSLLVPDPFLRERLVASVGIAMAGRDSDAALALVVGEIPPGDEKERAKVAIALRSKPRPSEDGAPSTPGFSAASSPPETVEARQSLGNQQGSHRSTDGFGDLPESILRDLGMARESSP